VSGDPGRRDIASVSGRGSSSTPARTLLRTIGGFRRWIAASAALGIITVGDGIGLIAMAAYLLTRSAFGGPAITLSLVILGVRFFAVSRVVARYCERYVGHLGTFRVLTRMRVWLYESLIPLSPAGLGDRGRGDIVTGLVDDIETMQDHLLRVSVPPIVAIGSLAIGGAVLTRLDPVLGTILVAVFVVTGLVLPELLHAATRNDAAALVRLQARRMTTTTEFLDGLTELVAWGRTDRLTIELAQLEALEAQIRRRLTIARAASSAVIIVLTGACAVAIIAVIPSLTRIAGRWYWFSAAPLVAIATFEALAPLVASRDTSARTDAAAARVLDIARSSAPDTTNDALPRRGPIPTAPSIEFDHVDFRHRDGPVILADATFSIPFGQIVVVTAPTGIGKSTIGDLLLGFRDADSGRILLGGVDIHRIDRIDRSSDRPAIVAVLQNDHVFDTTIRDNLLVANGDATDDEMLAACVTAGFLDVIESRDAGLDDPIGEDGALLSGGERQRLMIARAVLADAPILILDEATEHLEPTLRRAVIDSVLATRTGRTTIVLAHDADAIDRADAVYRLEDGTLRPVQP
jgi:ATP-binding cassette subfamily C protein CydC